MDPALPVARALAIAGERVAGAVGTHETALPSPERVDLGGRCVLPGFSDAHVHFPTWSVARREVRLGAGGVVEVDERGEPTGVLREECAWHFRDSYAAPSDEESVEAMREGLRVAAS